MSDTESDSNDSNSPSNRYVNDITLNLLMNRCHHKKYVSKTNPEEHKREQKHYSLLRKYKNQILDITRELLNKPDKQITTDVNEIFEGYTKTLIRYFKMKEIENKGTYNNSDEDVLFGNMNETDEDDEDDEDENTEKPNQSGNLLSLWGGSQVLKQNK
jgi:L-lactate utilization protein LutC